jgi:hypothetical protein
LNHANADIPYIAEAPQPLLREVPKGECYPVEALGPLRSTVEAVHDKTQAPVAIAAQSALSVASLAVQGFADVETLAGNSPCSLYCLTIAQSGERKSACDKFFMQAVRDFEADRAAGYRIDFVSHETALKLWEQRRSRMLKEAAGTGEKAIQALADLDALPPPPEPPLVPILTASEPTFPGLVKLFRVGRPALGLFTDEAGAFIGGHSMNSDNKLATVAGLSSLWDGSPINRTRSEDGASTIRGRRLASHLMAQPVAALPMLADPVVSQQGFLARFLITEPESTIGYRIRRGFDPASNTAIFAFSAKLRTILEAALPIREGTRNELEPRQLALSEDARELLTQYYEQTEREQVSDGELAHVRAYASKSAEQAARIAGVLTLWENQHATEVNATTMAQGISLAQFYLSEASRLADSAVISLDIERAELLRKWLLDKWHEPEILPREILRYGPNSLRESPTARAAISLLVQHGWLVALPEGVLIRGNNRKEVYQIVRSPHVV